MSDCAIQCDPIYKGQTQAAALSGMNDRLHSALRLIDLVMDSGTNKEALEVISILEIRVVLRTTHMDHGMWCQIMFDIFIEQGGFEDYGCINTILPRGIQYSILATRIYQNIKRLNLLPLIQALPSELRQTAAATARLTFDDVTIELLELVPLIYELDLQHHIANGGQSKYVGHSKRPLWYHFTSYLYLHAVASAVHSTQNRAVQLFKGLPDAGVSPNERCERLVHRRRSGVVYILPFIPEVSILSSMQPDLVDIWHMRHAVGDLPTILPWRIAANTCMHTYRPLYSKSWIPLPVDIVNKLSLKMEINERGHVDLKFDGSYFQCCKDLVNSSLSLLGEDLADMLYARWGFHEGRVCHHPFEDICTDCGYRTDMPENMERIHRKKMREGVISRGLIPPDSPYIPPDSLDSPNSDSTD